MLTSSTPGNQYLHPDYLSPVATTLDAKNSPLALLAQTCSSIGADNTNSKFFICIEKKNNKTREFKEKSSPVNNHSATSLSSPLVDNNDQGRRIGFKPYEPTIRERSTTTPEERSLSGIKTPKNTMTVSMLNDRCKSNQSATSEKETPVVTCRLTLEDYKKGSTSVNTSSEEKNKKTTVNPGSVYSSEDNLMARLFHPVDASTSSLTSSSSTMSATSSKISELRARALISGYCSPGGYPPSLSYPVDLVTANAFLTSRHHILRSNVSGSLLDYGRLKGATNINNGMISSICKDPYCKCCPPNMHFINKERGQLCSTGCNQCDQATFSKAYQENISTNAANVQEQLAAFTTSHYPYACNWVGADTYCGKRFLTSEELLHHLQMHSSTSESILSSAASSFQHAQDILQRVYSSASLSPLSPARYHPYSKPTILAPIMSQSLALSPEVPYPLYFSHYPLYGSSISNGSIHQ